MLYTIF